MKLTLDFVTTALELPKISGLKSDLHFSSITTDSRKIEKGALFVAIVGDQFDGHDFISKAVELGASGILATRTKIPPHLPKEVAVFAVNDSLDAYRTLAHAWRMEFKIPVIGVAGSVGKTSTKELLAALLRGKFSNVLYTQGSQNGYVGIPMTLLQMNSSTDAAVIEIGIDEIGAMSKHIELVAPTLSLLTAIGPEHLEKLIDVPTVAREEAIALEWTAQNGGAVVIRLDDEWIAPLANKIKPQFGGEIYCTWMESGHKNNQTIPSGVKTVKAQELNDVLNIETSTGAKFSIKCPLPGRHNASNLLTAISSAIACGLTPLDLQRGIQTFSGGAYGRSELKTFKGGIQVICDYYNANPTSVEAGLELLSTLSEKASSPRRIAVLGDMLELGTLEESLHRGLIASISKAKITDLFLYGPRMKWLLDEIRTKDPKISVHHFDSHESLATSVAGLIEPRITLLIKGSRGMRMEEVWKRIEPKLEAETKA